MLPKRKIVEAMLLVLSALLEAVKFVSDKVGASE